MRRGLICVMLTVVAVAACGDNLKKPPPVPPPGGGGGSDEGPKEVTCEALAPSANTCDVTPGGSTTLIKGTVLTATTVFRGGQVAVDDTGHISCVGCNCAAGGETTITCPDAAISPGLINTHDHITFDQNSPYTDTGERYEDRQQWREGLDQHHDIPAAGSANADQIRWAELRFLMGGATSIVGSGGQAGLLRNLDQANNQEDLGKKEVEFQTFPLDDANGTRRIGDCAYGGTPDTPTKLSVEMADAYEPHTSEGIDATARNEFLCETSTTFDRGTSNDLLLSKTAMIHGIGLQPEDYGAMSAAGTSLIWSPRSNITLYGETARVTTAARLGVRIALGTDWMPTGSMSLLRELACADSFNATYLDHFFRDDQLWTMVTGNAAAVTATSDVIGALEMGKVADIAIFASHGKKPFRSVIEAQPQDVALVMRGGKVLYGDDAVVSAFAQSCDAVDVCGTGKRVCLMDEIQKSYAALQTGATPRTGTLYPAFACGAPPNEPSCTPARPVSVAGSTIYTGIASGTDADGDGIPDEADNCPKVFNPVRPLDGGVQGDIDHDGQGDACDPCPFDANTTECTAVSKDDRDHDASATDGDNCPETTNPEQVDSDQDGKGDACDLCPTAANPGALGCPTTIYEIKGGTVGQFYLVRLTGVLVTGVGSNGFFVQIKDGDQGFVTADNSGLFVFTSAKPPAAVVPGARVTLEGSVSIFQGQTELVVALAKIQVAPGPAEALPAPVAVSYADIATGGPRATKLEGVLVSVGEATVTATNAGFGEITLTDASAHSLIADDFLSGPITLPATFQGYTSATGILAFRQSASKLEIRNAADLVLGRPGIASFGPANVFARVLATPVEAPTIPQPLTVTLTGPAKGDTQITLVSGNTDALTVVNLTVPDGGTTATVPVTALQKAASVQVTATITTQTLGPQSLTANVQVLVDTDVPAHVTLSPDVATIAPTENPTITATLDLPADADLTIPLSVTPATGGTVPAGVTILKDRLTGTFMFTNQTSSGDVEIDALFGTPPGKTVLHVRNGVNHLVINEADYDQSVNPDSSEFVELYNPTDMDIPLAGKALVLVNGNGNVVYGTPAALDLGGATANGAPLASLPSHGYLVIAGAAVCAGLPAATPRLQTAWATDAVQNGSPDGLALIDTVNHSLIDALSYEGAISAVTLPGFTAPVSLVQADTPAASVADPGDGSLCRSPDGAAWKLCTIKLGTPGAANP
ncbi:MAG TPA: amidohydrolase family protein [Kofleriaceae bacterium]|nr:amidohydrolase family protein [Kofleriaceae bacterium]